jgi:hypothetical protein
MTTSSSRARAPPARPATRQRVNSHKENGIMGVVTPGFLVALSAAVQHLDAGRVEMAQTIAGFLVKLLNI